MTSHLSTFATVSQLESDSISLTNARVSCSSPGRSGAVHPRWCNSFSISSASDNLAVIPRRFSWSAASQAELKLFPHHPKWLSTPLGKKIWTWSWAPSAGVYSLRIPCGYAAGRWSSDDPEWYGFLQTVSPLYSSLCTESVALSGSEEISLQSIWRYLGL